MFILFYIAVHAFTVDYETEKIDQYRVGESDGFRPKLALIGNGCEHDEEHEVRTCEAHKHPNGNVFSVAHCLKYCKEYHLIKHESSLNQTDGRFLFRNYYY